MARGQGLGVRKMGEGSQKLQKENKKKKKKKDTSWSWRFESNFYLAWQQAQILYISLECVPMTINSIHHCFSRDTSWQYIPLNHILLMKYKNFQLLWLQGPALTRVLSCPFASLPFCHFAWRLYCEEEVYTSDWSRELINLALNTAL